MMRSRLDFTLDEADNADNLLLWEQEVFSWAGSETEESRRVSAAGGFGVARSLESKSPNSKLGPGVLKGGLEVLLVGFALLYPPCALDSRFRGNDTGEYGVRIGADPLCRGDWDIPNSSVCPARSEVCLRGSGARRSAGEAPAGGLGVSPSFSTIPPRLGARGLKSIPSTLPHGFV
jgi:hypothetical protein